MQFEVGQIVEGKITSITNFGAFVDLGEQNSGLIHISEVSRSFVKNINDFFHVGQIIKCKIIDISNKGEIALSAKKVETDKPLKKFARSIKDGFEKKNKSSNLSTFEWQSPKKRAYTNFEDMLSMFKHSSEEKISGLKKAMSPRRSNGARRGSKSK